MTKLTRYYNNLAVCYDCFEKSVISYDILYDPIIYESNIGNCDICNKIAILLCVKNVTVLGRAKFKSKKKFINK